MKIVNGNCDCMVQGQLAWLRGINKGSKVGERERVLYSAVVISMGNASEK